MGFKVDYAAMQGLLGSYSGVVDTWSSAINSVVGQTESIEASTNIAGNNADRMREYLSTTYSFASTALFELLNTFKVNYLLYTEAYSQQIDGAGDAHIEETELSDRRTSLQGKRSQIQQIGISAESTVARVQDLVALPSLDIGRPDAKIGDILAFLDQLNSDVSSLEGAHVASDFTDIDALISQLTAFFQEMVGLSKEYKTNFTIESFAALASVQGLLQAIQDADDHLSAKAADVEVAIQHLEERLAREQAEREERERKAKWTKTGVNIAVGVVSAVAIVAFPAAAPLIGMASGIVTSAVSAAADEYVEHGWNMKNWDMGRIGVHSCIGALTGLISGCVPPGTGFVVKAGVKGLSSALEGAATTTYDQLATSGRITDGKAIALDALQKGGAAFAGSLVGGAIAENVKGIGIPALDMARDDPLSKLHGLSVFLYEGGKGAGVGVFSRGVSNLTGQVISKSTDGSFIKLNELDIDSVAKDMYSAESIGKDFVGDGLSGMARDHVEWRTPDKDTGLTPIIQYKLGHTTDPETGLTPVVQDSLEHMKTEDELSDVLAGMEERNPSTGANARVGQEELAGGSNTTGPNASFGGGNLTGNTDDIDWEHTSNTPEELRQLREMEQNGELDVKPSDLGPAHYSSNAAPLTEKPVEITFTYDTDKYDKEEFIAQGQMQEEGLNDLSVADYLDNYERYQAEGRAPDDAQRNYRLGIQETIADENSERQIAETMKANPGMSYEEASNQVNQSSLIRQARDETASQAALHNPDQIAGGDPQNVHAMGSGRVNSAYGSQWRSRSERLYQEVLRASRGMSREEMENTRLNVKFNYQSKNQ